MGGHRPKISLEAQQRKRHLRRIDQIASFKSETLKVMVNMEALQNSNLAVNQVREAMGVGLVE